MKRIIIVVLALVIILGLGILFLRTRTATQTQGQAILKVASTPNATIFLDNENIGKTPYEDKVKAGEYTLKLVPESTIESTIPWESKVTMRANLLTYVNRELRDSELTSAGEVLTLEKISGQSAELSIITTPDKAAVSIDGTDRGTAPLIIRDLNPGNYELTVSAIGYLPRTVKVKSTAGYKLNAVFNLASSGVTPTNPSPIPSPSTEPSGSGKASPSPSSKTSPLSSPKASSGASPKTSTKPKSSPTKPYVEILDTPTGFLNVRKDASTSSEVITRVNPGETYSLLDEQGDWYKIEYETDKTGWISNQYAKKYE
jgi:hypothetical protein